MLTVLKWHIKWNELLLSMIVVSSNFWLFLPTALQIGTSPPFTLYILHFVLSSPPLHLAPLFYASCWSCSLVLSTLMASAMLVCMCDKPPTNLASSLWRSRLNITEIVSLFSGVCVCVCVCARALHGCCVYLGARRPRTRWVGCLRAIKRISVQQQDETHWQPTHSYPTVYSLLTLTLTNRPTCAAQTRVRWGLHLK